MSVKSRPHTAKSGSVNAVAKKKREMREGIEVCYRLRYHIVADS